VAQPPLKQGTIAKAFIVPLRGKAKHRYGVVFTPDNELATSSNVGLVGISTSCYADDPDRIPLPWSEDGRVMTGLREPCEIVLGMTNIIRKAKVVATWGHVPREVLADMLNGLKRKGTI